MESFSETGSLISPAPIQETEQLPLQQAVVAPGTALSNVNQSAVFIKEEIMIAEEISVSEVTIKQEEEATEEGSQHYNDVNQSVLSIKEEIMIAEEISGSEVTIKQDEEATEEGSQHYNDVNQSVLSIKEEIMIAEEISVSEVTIKQDEEATEEGSQHYNDANQSAASIKEEIMIAEEISGSEVTIKQDEEATEEGSQHYNDVNQSVLSIKEEIMIAEEISVSEVTIKQDEEATEEGSQHYNDANQSAASIKEEIMIAEEISASEVTIKQEEEATEERYPHCNGCLERMKATLTEASHLINIDRTIAVTITVNVGYKPLNCTVCSFKAATAGDLKIHMMDVHKRKKSRNRRALKRSKPRILAAQAKSLERGVTAMLNDLKLNEAGKPHNCTHCSYKGATASDLEIHIVDVHKEKKPHNPLCETEKASIIERNDKTMLKDQKIKQGEKPHYCTNCSYKGAKASHLKNHVKDVHKDKKTHKRTHCTYKAAIADKLKMHIKDVHKIKKTRNRRRRRRGSKAAKAIGLKGDVSSMLNDLKRN